MYKLVTLILLFTTFTAWGQTETKKQSKWKIGLTFCPDIALRASYNENNIYLRDGDGYGSYGYYMDSPGFNFNSAQRFNFYNIGINFTAGLIGQITITPKLDIGTGIAYSKKDYLGRYHYVSYYSPLYAPSERIKQRFIEIPLYVRYNILGNKFRFHIKIGLVSGYLINKVITTDEGELATNKFQFSGEFGLGINFNMGERIIFSLTPNYNHSFTKFSDGANFKLHSIGIEAGFSYRIKRG